MPRTFDGPIHERPERIALSERLADLLDRLDFFPRSSRDERPDRGIDHLWGDRDAPDADKVSADDAARVGPAAPAIAAPVVAEAVEARVADTGETALHFQAEIDFNRHTDHYNSQALSAHADWFMI